MKTWKLGATWELPGNLNWIINHRHFHALPASDKPIKTLGFRSKGDYWNLITESDCQVDKNVSTIDTLLIYRT